MGTGLSMEAVLRKSQFCPNSCIAWPGTRFLMLCNAPGLQSEIPAIAVPYCHRVKLEDRPQSRPSLNPDFLSVAVAPKRHYALLRPSKVWL